MGRYTGFKKVYGSRVYLGHVPDEYELGDREHFYSKTERTSK